MAHVRKKVLVVDDEPVLRETLQYNLAREGYQVLLAATGEDGLRLGREEKPDLVLLDLMLPGMTGLEVCRELRRRTNAPVLMLTAKDSEVDKVIGLELGADDYITKPFSMPELMARVKAHLRRVEQLATQGTQPGIPIQSKLAHGELEIAPAKHEVRLRGETLSLKPKEYQLLLLLASNPGIVFTRETLLDRVWGMDYEGESARTVDVHINWLRKKIETDPARPRCIETVRGAGYRFAE
ncbi:MAG TPA: response regulator transcription factor [Chloroflexota bacterium]|jgi:DNA-binding response OmpR family regulator